MSTPAKKKRRERQLSSKWMTIQQVADHYAVDETTIRKKRGAFVNLRHSKVGERRTLIPRADVEKLDRDLLAKAM